jgi:hypothetical protein
MQGDSVDTSKVGSPGYWLDYLSQKLTDERSRISELQDYLEGNAPLPEGAQGMRAAYQSFQKKARTNFAELIVEAEGRGADTAKDIDHTRRARIN